jgi:Na+/proline symporter
MDNYWGIGLGGLPRVQSWLKDGGACGVQRGYLWVKASAYLLGVAALGIWFSRGIKSSKDFFLAGRSLPWWAAGLSLVVSDIGAKDMVGLAGDSYRYGLVMMNFDFIGCIFPVLIAAFLFMPFFWLAGVYTVPEYLGRRYNLGVRTFFAVIWVLFMVGTSAPSSSVRPRCSKLCWAGTSGPRCC